MSAGAPVLRERLSGLGGRPLWVVGLPLLLLGIGLALVSYAFEEPQTAERLGRNLPINEGAPDPSDITSHNSPTMLRNPSDAGNLVVANRIDSPRFGCAVHVSTDDGARWSQTPIPAPKGERACYAPDIAFTGDGTLHLSFVTLRGRANVPNAAWTASSTDGGKTFSKPVRVLGKLAFQVRLTADPAKPKRLYMTWLQASDVGVYKFTEPGNPIRIARSDDGGATWQPDRVVNSRSRQRVVAPSAAVGPRGEVYVLYLDLGDDRLDYEGGHRGKAGPPYPGPWKLVLARSQDDGQTWGESVVEERIVPAERFVVFTPPFPSIAVDPGSGRVYAGFFDRRLGDSDVWVWSLPKGGSDWKGPVRVNDTLERDGTSQYLPKLAVAPGGRVDVLYYDRRFDRRNVRTGASVQFSSDGGESFGTSVQASDRTFDSRVGARTQRGLPDPGNRLALLSTDSRDLAVWPDGRAGTRASRKVDLARTVIAFSDPARISDGLKYLLRFGGIALALIGLGLLATWAAGQGYLGGRARS
jgi:hypothetical protein